MPDLQIKSHPVPNYTPGRTSKIRYGVIHFVSARNYGKWKSDPYNMEGILKLFDEQVTDESLTEALAEAAEDGMESARDSAADACMRERKERGV